MRKYHGVISSLHMLSDALLIFISYFIAVLLRIDVLDGTANVSYVDRELVLAAAFCAAGAVLVFYVLRLYRFSRRSRRRGSCHRPAGWPCCARGKGRADPRAHFLIFGCAERMNLYFFSKE